MARQPPDSLWPAGGPPSTHTTALLCNRRCQELQQQCLWTCRLSGLRPQSPSESEPAGDSEVYTLTRQKHCPRLPSEACQLLSFKYLLICSQFPLQTLTGSLLRGDSAGSENMFPAAQKTVEWLQVNAAPNDPRHQAQHERERV